MADGAQTPGTMLSRRAGLGLPADAGRLRRPGGRRLCRRGRPRVWWWSPPEGRPWTVAPTTSLRPSTSGSRATGSPPRWSPSASTGTGSPWPAPSRGSPRASLPWPTRASTSSPSMSPAAPPEVIDFQVVDRTGVSAAAWLGASGQLVCEVVFERAPDQAAIAAALPQARLTWTDDTHLSLTWASPPAALTIPAGLAASRGSVLDGPLQLSLRGLQAGQLRRATVPAAVARPRRVCGSPSGRTAPPPPTPRPRRTRRRPPSSAPPAGRSRPAAVSAARPTRSPWPRRQAARPAGVAASSPTTTRAGGHRPAAQLRRRRDAP